MSSVTERKKKILELLSEDSTTSVTTMSKQLKVSAVTIRNDLNSLQEEGLIIRTHGGASPAFHKDIISSQRTSIKEKTAIAKEAARLIKDGDRIMLLGGSTCAMIVKFLLGKRDIHIVTNSTLALTYARSNPSLNVTLVGGEFEISSESLVGPITLHNLSQFNVQCCFIGADGFSLESGITSHLVETAEVAKMMIKHSKECIVVADSSKADKAGFAVMCPMTEIDQIITDSSIDSQLVEQLRTVGVKATIAPLSF